MKTMTVKDIDCVTGRMNLPFEKLTVAQLRHCLDKCGKAHKGMSKREMVRLLSALIGQPSK